MISLLKALNMTNIISFIDKTIKENIDAVFRSILVQLMQSWAEIVRVPLELNSPLDKILRINCRIDSFPDDMIPIMFRFDSKDQLRHLLRAFRFPEWFRTPSRHRFHCEEVLLAGLFRLHAPNVEGDGGWRYIFGYDQPTTSKVTNIFFLYMVKCWGYLLTDHLRFWKPYFPQFAELIRRKLSTLGCEFEPGTFKVFSFVDNTINATCRPGGGPRRSGVDAPRNDPLIQRAFYVGWKKLHGFKWETMDLPNGMNAFAWGPVSCRHNDLWTLRESRLADLLEELQQDEALKYCTYGDSAYVVIRRLCLLARHTVYAGDTPQVRARKVLENACMSSCREVIEWDYGDLGTYFSYVDYKKRLSMRKSYVGHIYLTAMILRNAMCCMRGNNTSKYYDYDYPDDFLYTWTADGPR
jgi:hypothetical protein